MSDMDLKTKLQRLCKERNWNQADVVRMIGETSRTTVSDWFNGIRQPDLKRALKLAKVFGVTVDYLADDDLDEMPAPELSDDDRMILRIARGMPVDEALKRLSYVPGVFQGVTSPRPPAPGSGGKKG